MQVETFEVVEVAHCNQEQLETIQSFVDSLGLEGQQRYFNRERPACPYRKLTAQEKLVYQTLCPLEEKITAYSDGPIPLRVLQVGSHAMEVLDGCELVVWHPRNGDVKDPVLLGKRKKDSWQYEYFLLARWGEVLDEFGVMVEQARKIIEARLRNECAKVRVELEASVASIEEAARDAVLTGKSLSVSFYFQ